MSDTGFLMGRLLGNAEKFSDKQIADTLELLVANGFTRGASDIHIEPHERFVLVRYRIDGALRGVHKLPRQTLDAVISGVKKRGGMHVMESRLPQEGNYEVRVGDTGVQVRASVMPVFGGEKAVLHLSVRSGKPEDLEALGFWGKGLTTLQQVLASPHGLVTVAGPRHSGVSSTLFSLLDQLNSPMVSIATIELRPKHRLPGVSQTYVTASGMSVHEGVQAALNQDPNILLLGDVPDGTTAQLAVHAATTGHLVIAGLHAENAIAAALRMRVAGVEPFLLVSALRASVGQRLVRTLCDKCRQRVALDQAGQCDIATRFGISGPAAYARVHELEREAMHGGLGTGTAYNTTPAHITHLWQAHPHGCEACDHTGYSGRTAIVEVLSNTDHLHRTLLHQELPSPATIQKQALEDGFIPMALDGLVKALRGQTTVTDVLHAVSMTQLA